ncbi:MAG TPA: Spy/CpxP family protein refolding chaperone [Devosiaceae bacterium]|jgi:hypothetical protein
MNMLPKTALAVLLAGTIGLGAVMPVAFAQDATPNTPQTMQAPHSGMPWHKPGMQRPGQNDHRGHMGMRRMPMMGGGFMALMCSPRGAEALDVGFLRLSYRLKPTADQQKLFDDLRTTALSAQKDYADTCAAARPQRNADGQPAQRPSLVDGLKSHIAIETAQVQALNTVMPKLEAFMNSLTDEQKAALTPHRQHGGMNGMRNRWQQHQGQGQGHNHGWNRHMNGQQQNAPAKPSDTPAAPAQL